MNILRSLDVDDLIMFRCFAEGFSITESARELNVTQPAVSQRIKKLEELLECQLFEKSGRNRILTQEGRAYASRAAKALAILEDFTPGIEDKVINLGTRPEVGRSWIWTAIKTLRKRNPEITYHLHFASGEEIVRNLGSGQLDAIVTSAPVMLRGFEAINLAQESYVFVAKPELAKTIKSYEDLTQHILIEHDRSFPFLRYVHAEQRSRLKFDDVWFLGSSTLMVHCVAAGYGVGIVPEYLALPLIKTKKLKKINLKLGLDHDQFKLIYTKSKDIQEQIKLLSGEMIKIGLR